MRTSLRWAVGVVLIGHGLLHLMGAAKGLGWTEVSQLREPIGSVAGVGWFVTAVLVVVTGALVVARRPSWPLAAVAAVLSQLMILTSWSDAKAGTAGNLLLVLVAFHGYRADGPTSVRARFRRSTRQAIDAVRRLEGGPPTPVCERDLAHLPGPVADYVRATGAVGRPRVTGFRARISGRIRSGPDAPWMRWVGEQVNTFGPSPTRVLFMDATMKGLPTDVLHCFQGPHATMQVRLASWVTVVDAHGPDMDQAETVTLFNDMCVLAPAALIDAPVRWADIDARHVRGSYTHAGHTATAVLTFDEAHRLVDFESDDRLRSSSDGRTFSPMRWSTPISRYVEFDGRLVGSLGRGRWHPDSEAPFDYLEFHTDELTYLTAGS
jgi:hypothetical protein